MNHRHLLSAILFFFIATFLVFSQQPALDSFKKTKDTKIQSGMSIQAVKAGIGNPREVKPGLPESDESIVEEFSKMIDEGKYSTLVYYYAPVIVELDSIAGYLVNDKKAYESDYKAYRKHTEVYLYDGKIISPDMAEGYKLTRSKKLTTEPIDPATTKTIAGAKYKARVVPIYCVIIDTETQVVVQTKAYFMSN